MQLGGKALEDPCKDAPAWTLLQVLEKRGELPGRPPLEDTRAYCINIGPRGVGPLLAAGMDLSALAAPSNGRLGMRPALQGPVSQQFPKVLSLLLICPPARPPLIQLLLS